MSAWLHLGACSGQHLVHQRGTMILGYGPEKETLCQGIYSPALILSEHGSVYCQGSERECSKECSVVPVPGSHQGA